MERCPGAGRDRVFWILLSCALASPALPAPAQEPSEAPQAPQGPPPEEKQAGAQDFDVPLDTFLNAKVGAGGELLTSEEEPRLVTVITEDEIRRSGARTLAQVLETVPGFEIWRDSLGRGRIVLWGVAPGPSSEGVLVLLNGRRLNESIHGGATAVNLDLSVANVKKIEILRGPGSVRYGAGGIEGVVNIVTESVDTFRNDDLTLGGGSFSSFLYDFRYGSTFRGLSFAGFVEYARTGGADLPVPEDAQTLADRARGTRISRAPGSTDDDRKTVEGNIALAYHELTLSLRFREENGGGFVGLIDALGQQNRLNNRQITLDAAWRRDLGPRASVRATAGYTHNEMSQFLDVLPPGFTVSAFRFPGGVFFESALNSRRVGGEVVAESRLFTGNTLSLGLGLERESTFDLKAVSNADVTTRVPLPSFQPVPALVPDASRRTFSVFLEDSWNPGKLGLTAGVRIDDYSDTGTAVTPRGGLVWRLPRGLNLKLAYGRGYRTPSFLERSYTSPGFIANPLLRPETADTVELAAGVKRGELKLNASGYLGFLRDVITATAPAGPTAPRRYVNLEGIDVRGVDVQLERGLGEGRALRLGYSYQHPTDSRTGARLPDAPSHLAYLGASFDVGSRVTLAPGARLRSERPRVAQDTRAPAGAYAIFDVAASARSLVRGIELQATLRNVFDQPFADPAPLHGLPGDYPRPGRAFFVRARYQF